jgi:hypothetical protein
VITTQAVKALLASATPAAPDDAAEAPGRRCPAAQALKAMVAMPIELDDGGAPGGGGGGGAANSTRAACSTWRRCGTGTTPLSASPRGGGGPYATTTPTAKTRRSRPVRPVDEGNAAPCNDGRHIRCIVMPSQRRTAMSLQ